VQLVPTWRRSKLGAASPDAAHRGLAPRITWATHRVDVARRTHAGAALVRGRAAGLPAEHRRYRTGVKQLIARIL
jgi:hypothetical protein